MHAPGPGGDAQLSVSCACWVYGWNMSQPLQLCSQPGLPWGWNAADPCGRIIGFARGGGCGFRYSQTGFFLSQNWSHAAGPFLHCTARHEILTKFWRPGSCWLKQKVSFGNKGCRVKVGGSECFVFPVQWQWAEMKVGTWASVIYTPCEALLSHTQGWSMCLPAGINKFRFCYYPTPGACAEDCFEPALGSFG